MQQIALDRFAQRTAACEKFFLTDELVEGTRTHPLGKGYKGQFVFGWRLPDGRTARLSLFTDDELEELVLATMMG
ncbi:MAG: hypothetical protein ABL961_14550, partial [Vicinamibacterales bacterium]